MRSRQICQIAVKKHLIIMKELFWFSAHFHLMITLQVTHCVFYSTSEKCWINQLIIMFCWAYVSSYDTFLNVLPLKPPITYSSTRTPRISFWIHGGLPNPQNTLVRNVCRHNHNIKTVFLYTIQISKYLCSNNTNLLIVQFDFW